MDLQTQQAAQVARLLPNNPLNFLSLAQLVLFAASMFFAAFLLLPHHTLAATITSTSNGNMTMDFTWDCLCVPTADDTVVVNHQLFIQTGESFDVANLIVNDGAKIRGYKNRSGTRPQITIHESLENSGVITSYTDVHLYGSVTNNGILESTLFLYEESIDNSFGDLRGVVRLGTDLNSTGDFSLPVSLDLNGHNLLVSGTAELYSVTGGDTISGGGTIVFTNQGKLLNTPEADVTYQHSLANAMYGTAHAQTITLTGLSIGLFYGSATFNAETITITQGTSVSMGGNTRGRRTLFSGDLINYGTIRASGTYLFGKNVRNEGVFEEYWNWPGNTVGNLVSQGNGTWLVSPTHAGLSSVPLRSGGDLYIGPELLSKQAYYVREQTDDGHYLPVRYINTTAPAKTTANYIHPWMESFEFDLIRDQNVNQYFPVTIRAKDPEFTGRLRLTASNGEIYPGIIDIEEEDEGVWKGEVKLFSEERNTSITITDQEDVLQGQSNKFEVNVPNKTNKGMLKGKLLKASGVGLDSDLSGLIITLSDERGESYSNVIETGNSFTFTDIPCGSYATSIDGETFSGNARTTITCSETTTKSFLMTPACQQSDLIPVLLVPGIMGSTENDFSKRANTVLTDPIPLLTRRIPFWNSDELQIHDPYSAVGFSNLINTLEAEGYREGCDIFTVPYDWSLSVPKSSELYLEPWVNHAKAVASSTQVDIVAHSMGGLLSRAYIQNENRYQNDIRKLIMVGTPNQGSANTYFGWILGNPIQTDGIVEYSIWKELFNMDQFQTHTINENHKIKGIGDDLCSKKGVDYTECDTERTKDFLYKKAQSVGNLYPTYDFLFDKNNDQLLETSFKNTFLSDLNNKNFSSTSVKVYRIAGVLEDDNGNLLKSTLKNIYVDTKKTALELFIDGTIYSYDKDYGDGTVLKTSLGESNDAGFDTEHINLIEKSKDTVIKLLKL